MRQISIVVPIYNVEKMINRCLDSILKQTFSNFELILVDDGSSDNCSRICDEYLADRRVSAIHQKNCGVSMARNNGILFSTSEFLTFVDSDDFINPDFLQVMFSYTNGNKAQMVLCDYCIDKGNTIEEKRTINSEYLFFSNREAIQFYGIRDLKYGSSLFRSPCAKLISRKIVLSNLFPKDRTYAEDAACVYLWMWASKKIVHIDFCGYHYCQNPDSICHKKIGEFYLGNFLTEQEWISFFRKNSFDELYQLTVKRYYIDADFAYRESDNKELFLLVLRRGLRKYRRKAGIPFKGNEYYYELAFPKRMLLYWYYQSLKAKLKRK